MSPRPTALVLDTSLTVVLRWRYPALGTGFACEVQVESGGAFTLKCVMNGRSTEIQVPKGSSRHRVR